MKEHWFWWLVMMAVLAWYSTITVFIAVRGALDIRDMLRRLAGRPRATPGRGGSDRAGSPP